MVNITLTISEDLKKKLQKHKEVNWSAISRIAFEEHLKKIEMIEKIAQKSQLEEKDVEFLANKIKKEMAKNHSIQK